MNTTADMLTFSEQAKRSPYCYAQNVFYDRKLVRVSNVDLFYSGDEDKTYPTIELSPIGFSDKALFELVRVIANAKVLGEQDISISIDYQLDYAVAELKELEDKGQVDTNAPTYKDLTKALEPHNYTVLGVLVKHSENTEKHYDVWTLPNGIDFTNNGGSFIVTLKYLLGYVLTYLIREKIDTELK